MASNDASTSSTSPSSTTVVRVTRTSIHTPLKPASVQDLKAKFDPGKAGDCSIGTADCSTLTITSQSVTKSNSPTCERKSTAGQLFQKDTSVLSTMKSSTTVTLSSLNSSLQAAAQRKLGSSATSDISSSSSVPTSNLRSVSKSLAVTAVRPFSPSSLPSSKPDSASSSGRSSPVLEVSTKNATSCSLTSVTNKREPKSMTKTTWSSITTSTSHSSSQVSDGFSSSEFKSCFQRDKNGRLELPVMHITTSGSDVTVELKPQSATLDSRLRSITDNDDTGLSYLRKRNLGAKTTFNSNISSVPKSAQKTEATPVSIENSPPVERCKKLVAREIKIERLESGENVTSYKDGNPPEKTKSTVSGRLLDCTGDPGNKVREIKVERITSEQLTSSSPKTDGVKPEVVKVRLMNLKSEDPDDSSKLSKGHLKDKNSDNNDRRISRKMSSERFERLVFDFQRGVPTESILRKESETDHIALQQKARELSKPVTDDDVPIIIKKKKEPSIFTEGLKVSDFVKQVNKMNPEVEGPPKWKVQRAQSHTSSIASTSSDAGTDNVYLGIPGDDVGGFTDEDDDIYEKVSNRAESHQDGEPAKIPERRLGFYRKDKGSKQKGRKSKSTKSVSDSEERVIHSDGEGGWEQSDLSSSGTEYEDIGPDGDECLYEDVERLSAPASDAAPKSKTISHKIKNIFYKSGGNKNKRNKSQVDSGVSAGTDSEGEDTDEVDNDLSETLSHTSSERSSGRLSRDSATLSSISTTTSIATTASNADDTAAAATTVNLPQPTIMASSNMPPPPPLPPRTTKALNQAPENSPPLPPRNTALSNRSSLGVTLDTVVPLSPSAGSAGRAYSNKSKDRYSYGASSHDSLDSGSTSGKIEYIDYDPASPMTLERLDRSERKTIGSIGSRPASGTSSTSSPGLYVYPDISAFPELKGDSGDDNLYVDLEDEQIYGKSSAIYVSKFESEPLYQWYSKDKVIQNMRSDKSTSDDLSSDDEYLEGRGHSESVYEDVEKLLEKTGSSTPTVTKPNTSSSSKAGENKQPNTLSVNARDKPQRRSVIEEVFKNGGNLHRALWCQMPEVIESGLLEKLTDQEKKVQEAMFEIITSEASYLKSLKILLSVFLMSPEFSADMTDRCVVSRRDRQVLFSNIGTIKDISEGFLRDLEERWQESCYMKDVCDIINKHATKNFEPYVRYCGNQAFQDRALNNLKQNSEFSEAVKRLEQHPDCQFLPLSSFLLLPMQRITRLPLLVDAICRRLEPGKPAYISAKRAMDSLTRVAKRCDDAAKKMQQTEQMCELASNLEFKIKEFPLISASRFLVKQGELTLIKGDSSGRKTLSKLLGSNKEHVYLFLFNDILLVTKKKSTTFQVRDYCQRNSLHLEAVDNSEKSRHIAPGATAGISHILFLVMLANHDNKQVELVLSCKSESERTRWIDAIMPPRAASESERIYDYWDCPQFHCVKKYIAQQPDELTLEESDVINVTRKMADGWYEGERIRDGERGWFPASHTEEINNSHVRARNLRLRYRLMRASQDFSHAEFRKK